MILKTLLFFAANLAGAAAVAYAVASPGDQTLIAMLGGAPLGFSAVRAAMA